MTHNPDTDEHSLDPLRNPKRRIAPEMIVAGLAVLGMIVVGVLLVVRSGGNTEVASATVPLTEPVSDAESAQSESAESGGAIAETDSVDAETDSFDAVAEESPSAEAPASDGTAPATPPPAKDETTTSTSTTTSTTTTVKLDPEEAAAAQLVELMAADASSMPALEETWVPQLSAKEYGTRWNGIVYDYEAILFEHKTLRERFDAILVDGGTYSFRLDGAPMTGWYMTIVPTGYSSAEGALAWCASTQLGVDDCFAKLITNRPDPGPTVKTNK